MTAVVKPKIWLSPFDGHQPKKNRHTTRPQIHIAFIMPRPKDIGSHHKSWTGNNQSRKRTTPRDNRCFNHKESQSKRKYLSSRVISMPPQLNNSVINPPQMSLVRQQSFSSSQNTPRNNRCFNSKESNSNRNELSSTVIPVPTAFNDSVINPPQLSSVCQQSSRSSHNTTPEWQASSIPGQTSPNLSNTMPPPSTQNGSRNVYGCMVDVSKLTPSQRQHHAVMLLHNYLELCNTNDHSSMFVSLPTIPNIESLSLSTILSLDIGSFFRNRDDLNIQQQATSEVANT